MESTRVKSEKGRKNLSIVISNKVTCNLDSKQRRYVEFFRVNRKLLHCGKTNVRHITFTPAHINRALPLSASHSFYLTHARDTQQKAIHYLHPPTTFTLYKMFHQRKDINSRLLPNITSNTYFKFRWPQRLYNPANAHFIGSIQIYHHIGA